MALLGEARDARPCAGHPRLCSIKQERRGWPGRSPAMTKKRIIFKLLGRAGKSRLHFRSGSQDEGFLTLVVRSAATPRVSNHEALVRPNRKIRQIMRECVFRPELNRQAQP